MHRGPHVVVRDVSVFGAVGVRLGVGQLLASLLHMPSHASHVGAQLDELEHVLQVLEVALIRPRTRLAGHVLLLLLAAALLALAAALLTLRCSALRLRRLRLAAIVSHLEERPQQLRICRRRRRRARNGALAPWRLGAALDERDFALAAVLGGRLSCHFHLEERVQRVGAAAERRQVGQQQRHAHGALGRALLVPAELCVIEARLLAQHAHQVRLLDVEDLRVGQRQSEHEEHGLRLQRGQLGEQLRAGQHDTLLNVPPLRLLETRQVRHAHVQNARERHRGLRVVAVQAAAATVAHRAAHLDRIEGVGRAHHEQSTNELPVDGRELVHVACADESGRQPGVDKRHWPALLDADLQLSDPFLDGRERLDRARHTHRGCVGEVARRKRDDALLALGSKLVHCHLQRRERLVRE